MTDFFDILEKNGVEIPEEKKKAIKTDVLANYKTINEYDNKVNGLNDELKTAKGTIEDLNKSVDDLKQAGTNVEDLQKQIKAYQDAEDKRKQEETEALELENLKGRFNPLKGEHKFINEGTEKWIFSEFRNALNDDANKGKSDKEIFDALTKDKVIYQNPNGKIDIPPAGDNSGEGEVKFKRFF